jgi:hypothetical protein
MPTWEKTGHQRQMMHDRVYELFERVAPGHALIPLCSHATNSFESSHRQGVSGPDAIQLPSYGIWFGSSRDPLDGRWYAIAGQVFHTSNIGVAYAQLMVMSLPGNQSVSGRIARFGNYGQPDFTDIPGDLHADDLP